MKIFITQILLLALFLPTQANDINKLIKEGKQQELNGNFAMALEIYHSALIIEPENPKVHLLIGSLSHSKDALEEALIAYNNAIAFDATMDEAYFKRATLYSDLGKYDKAISDLNLAIEINPNEMMYYMNRAFLQSNINNVNGAINDFSIACQISPEESQSYFSMAKAMGMIKNEMLVCNEIFKLKNEGSYRAEVIYNNFCNI